MLSNIEIEKYITSAREAYDDVNQFEADLIEDINCPQGDDDKGALYHRQPPRLA